MLNRMKIYTVHIKPEDTGSRFNPIFIKEGFNFAAFLFTIVWAFYKRLWFAAIGLLIISLFLMVLLKAHVLTRISIVVLHLGVNLLAGFFGNDWVRARLRRQGYILSDITAADSYLRAQQRYLERYLEATAQ